MIDAKRVTIRDILDKSVQYKVPENQRNFEWKKENAEMLWEDISSGGAFLGTIVLDVHDEKDKEILIVDGQQRLTTIFILLSACKNQCLKIGEIRQAQTIQQKISFIDDTSGKELNTKLISSPSIKDVFELTIADYDWLGKFNFRNKARQTGRIKPIYDYFCEKISGFDQNKIKETLESLYQSIVVRIEIEDTREAFDIFERMNARGAELNAADLLKNYLFSKEAGDSLSDRWNNIVDNSINNIVRMIKYFYVSNLGYIQKKNLFNELKRYGETKGASRMLEEIEKFSRLYQLIGNSTENSILEWSSEEGISFFANEYNYQALNRAFDGLSLFGISQVYPIIIKSITAIISISDNDQKEKLAKKFLRFVESLEKYHFINNAISQRPGNEVEKYYADQCRKELKTVSDIDDFWGAIINDLSDKLVDWNEFIGRFMDLNYEDDPLLIYYINDRMNAYKRKGGQIDKIYNPDKKIIKRNFNIDHLISQDLSEYDFDINDLGEDNLHNIGNLLVVSIHTNSLLGNKNIKDKFDIMAAKERLPEAAEFVSEWKNRDWSSVQMIRENITERARGLGEKAYKEVWAIN